MNNKINVMQRDKTTNLWQLTRRGKSFSWLVSASFSPQYFKITFEYQNQILTSNLKPMEKLIMIYLATHLFYGTPVCLYGATKIASDLGISYRTARTALKGLEDRGAIIVGEMAIDRFHPQKQYMINTSYQLKDQENGTSTNDYPDDMEPAWCESFY